MSAVGKHGRGIGRAAAVAVLGAALLPASVVRADDAGARAFFLEQSGYGQPAPQPTFEAPAERPLIVKRKRIVSRKTETKIAVGPKVPVTIYDDQTLRAGDAVMTSKGLRVFVGDRGATHSDADFVALSDAEGLPKQVEKELLVVDKAPHG